MYSGEQTAFLARLLTTLLCFKFSEINNTVFSVWVPFYTYHPKHWVQDNSFLLTSTDMKFVKRIFEQFLLNFYFQGLRVYSTTKRVHMKKSKT